MIQDISPKKLYNHYDPTVKPAAGDFVVCIKNNKVLVSTDNGEMTFATVKAITDNVENPALTYLFSVDEEKFFLVNSNEINDELSFDSDNRKYLFLTLNEIRDMKLDPWYRNLVLYTAKHLADWYRDNCFCGRCGTKMLHSEKERAMKCPNCGYTSYPRIMPAVIVGVINGDTLLLTKYRSGYGHNALIAGFTEIGETVEETVAREVMEESGLKVKNIRYYKSQPWGSANDILLGFYCDVDGSTEIHMDDQELKYAEWVQRENIVLQPDEYSLTNEMMKMFKEGKQ